ncbi:ATP-dependent protease subunit HslV [Hyphomonas sp.]|uniref:ATP-dependent protease subunit HslV n=1 Tax=Hyphomonas sp. TaxID=87 RepID=UPI001DE76B35|nr:ATP-dependent protease subunit HslV [Hyphomonas sp.]MBU3921221.1 ATP-dependent protease subunit HslV [Alphaproteobacteria bacterium]MBU4061223.1 ATP-dependent protease subunit HslV [Alphaproteobacteria bacterium]MBU4165135.1 ATP-dependent protease subunit HslV [Alphaproteobacteria bacterium]
MTMQENSGPGWHGTTVLAVRKGSKLVMLSDGQVSMGSTIMKGNARKVRRIADGKILAGFAGATADAFTLFERLEQKLERFPGQLQRAAVELAKDWRTERYLQKLEALLIVADRTSTLVITGSGDVLEPEHPVVAIGSGGNFALAAARGLYEYEQDAELIGRKAMTIAADICVYTNNHFTLETLDV